jgi:hypothetical protein
MNQDLKLECEKFLHGHVPQKAGEEFGLIANWCRQHSYQADVYGKGELISSFEKKVAELLGFDAGCFMPSGTMAQQIALKIYADKTRNNNFAIHPTSHLELHERHAYAHLSNLKSVIIGNKNRQLNAEDIRNSPTPISTIVIELPAREIGGQLPGWDELDLIKSAASTRGFFLHMDGARLWETKSFYEKSWGTRSLLKKRESGCVVSGEIFFNCIPLLPPPPCVLTVLCNRCRNICDERKMFTGV